MTLKMWCRKRTYGPGNSLAVFTVGRAVPGCSRSCAIPITPGCSTTVHTSFCRRFDRGWLSACRGRLDYLENRPVAAVVYHRRQHVINLFIWPAPRQAGGATIRLYQGYTLRHWTTAGMTYWAISDLHDSELREFVRLVQQHSTPPPAP